MVDNDSDQVMNCAEICSEYYWATEFGNGTLNLFIKSSNYYQQPLSTANFKLRKACNF